MKILYITNNVSTHGGANKSMIDICNAVRKLGHSVVVVSPNGASFCEILQKNGIKNYIIRDIGRSVTKSSEKGFINTVIGIIKNIILTVRIKGRVKSLCKIISEEKIDIVHTNTSVSFEGVLAAEKMGIPHIWHIREFLEEDYRISFTKSKEYMRNLFSRSSSVICISNSINQKFKEMIGSTQCNVIYNAITRPNIKGEELTTKKNEKIFVIVGKIQYGKGIHDAIEAFGIASKKLNNIRLWIVGNYEQDEYYFSLQEIIKKYSIEEKVVFWGAKNNVGDVINAAYCGLMCSYNEGLGRVTVEYMLCGKPVIGAHSGGTLEIITEGVNGIYYQPGNAEDLAEKMIALYENEELAKQLGVQGKSLAEEKFGSQTYAEKLISVYENALKNR